MAMLPAEKMVYWKAHYWLESKSECSKVQQWVLQKAQKMGK